MIACAAPADDDGERPDAVASATAPPLPSLKNDNCIINGRYRSVFVAQENIRLFIWKTGEENVGALTVTAAECLSVKEFQDKWHSYLNALKRELCSGMWTRERQPRSGNWHAHAAVNVGWDIKTGFPRDQVASGFYVNVDPRLRALWKYLRDRAASHGFGRVELLPLKYSGAVCARYFTKYLTKVMGSEKQRGEERCRLFGIWGGVRFVHPRFSFVSSRIVEKRKEWLAGMMEVAGVDQLKRALGKRWWFHHGRALREVIMPEDFYKIGPSEVRRWDKVGLDAYSRDISRWPGPPSDDLILRSQFNLFYDIGVQRYGKRSPEALRFAMYFLAAPTLRPSGQVDPQLPM